MQLLNTDQAAERLTVKKCTLEKWRVTGFGPPFVKYGRAVRYRTEDINAFILSSLQNNTSDYDHRPGAHVGLIGR